MILMHSPGLYFQTGRTNCNHTQKGKEMETILGLFSEYRVYIIVGLLVVVAILCLSSASLRGQLKKGAMILGIVVVLGGAYYLITGNSPLDLPGDIIGYFDEAHTQQEADHLYYKDPDKRYKDQLQE